MVNDLKIGTESPIPGIVEGMDGAPLTIPGRNDGTDKTKMTGKPATEAVAPAPVSADLEGGPHYVQVDPSKIVSNDPSKIIPKTDPDNKKGDEIIGYDRQIGLLLDAAKRYAPESDEDRKKRERRERSKRIIGAVSDGLSALSNLYFTSQYAPDMYDHERGSILKSTNNWIEKMKAEREANADRYLTYSLKIGELENAREQQAYQRGRDALADKIRAAAEERAQLKADRDAAMQALKLQLMQGKINEQEAEAKAAEIEANYADQYWEARVEELGSRKRKNDRWQPRIGGRGRGGNSGGGSGGGNLWYAVDSTGQVHEVYAKSEAQAHSVAGGRGLTLVGSVKESSSVVGNTSTNTNAFGETSTNKNTRNTRTSSRNKTVPVYSTSQKKIGW